MSLLLHSSGLSGLIAGTRACMLFRVVMTNTAVENPFGSVHAAALLNVGELTAASNVISICQELKPKGSRAIPVAIRTRFYKKVTPYSHALLRHETSLTATANFICLGTAHQNSAHHLPLVV